MSNKGVCRTAPATPGLLNILFDFLLEKINPSIDPEQCGGLRKTSGNHYLIKLIDFANRPLDKNTPHTAVLCTKDLSSE